MSSRHTFTSSFDPFGPNSQTPPPTKRAFPPLIREHLFPEPAPRYVPTSPLSGSYPFCQQNPGINCTHFNPAGSWTYNQNFGIIHDGACNTCTEHVKHVWEAMNLKGSSMTEAMRPRTNDFNVSFMDSFDLGFRQYGGNGRHIVSETADQLEIVMKALELCEAENVSLRQDLQRTQSELAISQTDLGRLKDALASQTSPIFSVDSVTSRIPPSDSGSMSFKNCASSSAGSFREQNMQDLDFASVASSPPKPEPCEVFPRAVDPLDARCLNFAENSPPHPRLTYASVASTHASQNNPTHYPSTLSAKLLDHTPPSGSPSPENLPAYSRCSKPLLRQPKTIAELKDLIALAGDTTPEGDKALAIVKRVCFGAHNTPRELKTGLQKFALTHWRNPLTTSLTQSSSVMAKSNPRLGDPVEVWYDYLCTHPHSWPKGVRKDADGKPVMSDLIASRAVAQMRPTESASLRNDFNNQVADMFSIPGMYQHLIEQNGFAFASQVTFELFTGLVTVEGVAQHFSRCGFTLEDATKNFEPWAKHWKECY
jgi:hypothetical protein